MAHWSEAGCFKEIELQFAAEEKDGGDDVTRSAKATVR